MSVGAKGRLVKGKETKIEEPFPHRIYLIPTSRLCYLFFDLTFQCKLFPFILGRWFRKQGFARYAIIVAYLPRIQNGLHELWIYLIVYFLETFEFWASVDLTFNEIAIWAKAYCNSVVYLLGDEEAIGYLKNICKRWICNSVDPLYKTQ